MGCEMIGIHLKTMSNLIKKKIDFLSKDVELTGFQSYLLGYLIHESEQRDIFQRDVERHLEISRASVTNILQLLEKNGFIRREAVSYDARLKKIAVTEKGYAANKKIIDILKYVDSSLQTDVTKEEMEVFMTVLEKMKKNLERT